MSKALELLANIDKKVQQRITEYRGTTSERHRANVTDYQRQLEHKSKYHVERYPTVGRGDLTAHSERLTADRDATRPVPSLATVQIEPFKANERSNKDSRAPSTEPTDRKEVEPFEYGTDFSSSYIRYSHYCARVYGQEQVQRDKDPQYHDRRETNESRPSEQIGGQSEYQHVQELIEQQTTTVRTDKQGRRELAGRIYDSNGVLNDDRARSTTIADYRRTTDAITRATAKFRSDAKQSYERIVGTVKGNRAYTATYSRHKSH